MHAHNRTSIHWRRYFRRLKSRESDSRVPNSLWTCSYLISVPVRIDSPLGYIREEFFYNGTFHHSVRVLGRFRWFGFWKKKKERYNGGQISRWLFRVKGWECCEEGRRKRERRKYKVPPIKQLTSAKPVCLIAPAWQTSCLKGWSVLRYRRILPGLRGWEEARKYRYSPWNSREYRGR